MTPAEREAWRDFSGGAIAEFSIATEQAHGVPRMLIHKACWQVRRATGVTP